MSGQKHLVVWMAESPIPFGGSKVGEPSCLWLPFVTSRSVCSGGWRSAVHAVSSCCLHISSRIQSRLKRQAKWQQLQLAPFPEKLYLVPSKAVGFKMAGSSGLKMAIRKELTMESDPRMRNRPLGVNDYYVLPGVLFSSPRGLGQIKTNGHRRPPI